MKLQKHWFTLKELSNEWNLSINDLIHFAYSGDLEVCTDWNKLAEQFYDYHDWGGLNCGATFIEQHLYAFTKPEHKRPEVISNLSFIGDRRAFFLSNQDRNHDSAFCRPNIDEDTPFIARLIALKSELFLNIFNDNVWLPSSSTDMFPERIGYLSDYDFCLFSNEIEGISLSIDNLVVTRNEKIRVEAAEKNKNNITSELAPTESTFRTVGVLLELLKQTETYKSDADLIRVIEQNYFSIRGLSKRTLEENFKKGKDAFEEAQKR